MIPDDLPDLLSLRLPTQRPLCHLLELVGGHGPQHHQRSTDQVTPDDQITETVDEIDPRALGIHEPEKYL